MPQDHKVVIEFERNTTALLFLTYNFQNEIYFTVLLHFTHFECQSKIIGIRWMTWMILTWIRYIMILVLITLLWSVPAVMNLSFHPQVTAVPGSGL